MYLRAFSFRNSNYFVSYFAQAMCILSLVELDKENESSVSKSSNGNDLASARPYQIEIPSSLSSVVANWNLPMHRWLKKCQLHKSMFFIILF